MNNHNPTPMRHHFLQPLLLFLMLFATLPTLAQELKVKDMYIAEGPVAIANDLKYIPEQLKNDPTKKYALVRVKLALNDVEFDGLVFVATKKTGEYWVWINADYDAGAHSLTIKHPDFKQLDVKFDDYKIDTVIHKSTYVLDIEVPPTRKPLDYNNRKKFTIRISPKNAKLSLDDVGRDLIEKGEYVEYVDNLASGTHDYSVSADYYRTAAGSFDVGDNLKDTLITLDPEMGTLSIKSITPYNAQVFVDEKLIDHSQPISIQAGPHKVRAEAKDYKGKEEEVVISDGKTREVEFQLSRTTTFKFTSKPSGAEIVVDGKSIGKTGDKPIEKEYTTGEYTINATKKGYKYLDDGKKMHFDSSNPEVMIILGKIYNDQNEFYAEGNVKAGSFMGFGATIGGYFMNINAELAYMVGSGKSETIYWSGNNTPPIGCTYSPSTNFTFKLGYGIPFSNRYRITPQVGIGMVKLKETIEEGNGASPADGANTTMGLVGVRFSAAIADHIGVSISPEFGFSMSKSKGFEALSEVSSDIKKWGEGFNVKLGLTAFF